MTSATPKSRAGEHSPMCIWDDCDQDAIYCEGHAREYMQPDIDTLRERERELVEALRNLMPVAKETCKQWPNDEIFSRPFLEARSLLAKHGR